MDFNSMIAHVRRAMSLDQSFYREVANDERYNREALLVVIVASVLTGIGRFLGSVISGNLFGAVWGLVVVAVVAVVGYYVWAFVAQFVGKSLFQGQATTPQLLRTLGYAYGPTALGVLAFIPCIGWPLPLLGGIWSLVCGFFAVRETHKLSDGQTIVTVVVSWLVVAIVTAVVGLVLGIPGMGLGALLAR